MALPFSSDLWIALDIFLKLKLRKYMYIYGITSADVFSHSNILIENM